jgi:hypothetical protein
MDKFELEKRTKKFAVSVIRFVQDLPKDKTSDVLGYQLLKSGTSVVREYLGLANYYAGFPVGVGNN